MLWWLFILGEPNKSLWFYGRTTEKQKYWIDHSIFCHFNGWSNVSCINQNAFWFRWLPNKKGRYSKITVHTLISVVWWLSYCTKIWEILNHESHWLTLGHWLYLHRIHLLSYSGKRCTLIEERIFSKSNNYKAWFIIWLEAISKSCHSSIHS